MATEQALETGPPKKLLCLDGGGVKGYSSLLILRAVMKEVQEIEDGHSATVDQSKPGMTVTSQSMNPHERKPNDYFDLTGGTSTGGIIAVMLGRLNMNCTQALKVYEDISKDIFAIRAFGINISNIPVIDRLGPLILKVKLLFGSQFSSKYLDQSIEKILNDRRINPDGGKLLVTDRFSPYNASGKMLMCATMADRGKALLFRDYTPPADAIPETALQRDDEELAPPAPPYFTPGKAPPNTDDKTKILLQNFRYDKVTIQQAIRATSAAPTYLPPEIIQKIQFWDGGCLNNNPIDQVWAARYDLTPNTKTEPYVSTILSIGTTYTTQAVKTPMGAISRLLGILNRSLDFMTNTEAKHKDFKRNIYRRNLRQSPDQQTSYFRFNASTGDVNVNLADYKKLPFLKKITEDYLAIQDTKDKITACAQLLAKRKGPHA